MTINPNGAGGAHCACTFFGRLFLLKIKVLEGPNSLTFPICLWRTPLLPFGSSKRPKMGVLVHSYRQRDRFLDPKIHFFFAFFEAKMRKNDIPNPKLIDPNDNQPFYI